jgi:hypothetical protein
MKTLTHEQFQQWVDTYGRASAENNPQTSANLFAESAAYYEGLCQIFREWWHIQET